MFYQVSSAMYEDYAVLTHLQLDTHEARQASDASTMESSQ